VLDIKMDNDLWWEIHDKADVWGLSMSKTAMVMLQWYVDNGPKD
jgi:hypothetical protein